MNASRNLIRSAVLMERLTLIAKNDAERRNHMATPRKAWESIDRGRSCSETRCQIFSYGMTRMHDSLRRRPTRANHPPQTPHPPVSACRERGVGVTLRAKPAPRPINPTRSSPHPPAIPPPQLCHALLGISVRPLS